MPAGAVPRLARAVVITLTSPPGGGRRGARMSTAAEFDGLEIWFLTGSQSLYGDDALRQVAEHSRQLAEQLDASADPPVRVVWKPVLSTSDAIRRVCLDATAQDGCVGVLAWMHTFSPVKMWIAGLPALDKPLLHLHTQFNLSLPWSTIDMDFMNLN